jgi:ATP-dependent Clp protease protease subunit
MAVLKIYGDIGEPFPGGLFMDSPEMISSKMVSDFIDDHQADTEITVRINSRGGDVQEGWAIADLLMSSGKKIKTIGEGKVYSIATIIFLAGSEREMMKNADGLIHNPFIPPYTLADQYESGDLEKLAESLKQEEQKILNFYSERTGTAPEKLAEYMSNDTKLSADDMLMLGFATKIIEPILAYAYIKPKNKFIMDEKAFFEKLGSTLDSAISKIKNFSRVEAENLTLTDVDGKQLNLEKSEGEPAVGDTASPDGEYKMEGGKTIVVADGKVTEIREAEQSELELAQAKIAELTAELENAKVETEKAAVAQAAFKAKEAEAVALVDELSKLKNSWKPDTRTKVSTAEKVGEINLTRVKELREKLQNAKSE